MLVFDLWNNNQIPFGTAYTAGSYTLTGLTIGHLYYFVLGANETSLTNTAQTITNGAPTSGNAQTPGMPVGLVGNVTTNAGWFIAQATSVVIAGSGTNLLTCYITDVTVPQSSPVPAEGSKPRFSFPVQGGLGGALGREADMSGIYCCWSSTQATKTIAAASGELNIILKG